MTDAEHQQHEALHQNLVTLVNLYLDHGTPLRGQSRTSIYDSIAALRSWSCDQTMQPTAESATASKK